MPSFVSDTLARKSTLRASGDPLPPEAGKPPYPECFQSKTETSKDTFYFFNSKCSGDYSAVTNDYWYYKENKMQLPITITEYAKDYAIWMCNTCVSSFTIKIPKP